MSEETPKNSEEVKPKQQPTQPIPIILPEQPGNKITQTTRLLEDILAGDKVSLENSKIYIAQSSDTSMAREPLKGKFFARESEQVAKDLVGKLLVRGIEPFGRVSGVITQVDAYSSPGKHVKIGKKNQGAFYAPGAIHMYPSQGAYCLAISTLAEGVYNEVLIRQLSPLEGISEMRENRGNLDEKELTNGPSKIVKALGLTKDHDGLFIFDWENASLWIEEYMKTAKAIKEARIENASPDFIGRYTLSQSH